MKRKCITCDKVYYPTKNNYVGYPYFWHIERAISIDRSHDRVFCTRNCMDNFLAKHSDIIIPIFKQIKESEDINNARIRKNKVECEQATSP